MQERDGFPAFLSAGQRVPEDSEQNKVSSASFERSKFQAPMIGEKPMADMEDLDRQSMPTIESTS